MMSARLISAGGPGQPVAALGAPAALEQAGLAQLGQDGFQELRRDLLGGGQALPFDRAATAGRPARSGPGPRSRLWRRSAPGAR